jgi:S-adenosylmethionine-dependent methyltransferase
MKKNQNDRNFDRLVDKFAEKVYGTVKGDWRLKLLKEDLAPFYDAKTPLNIWDAGCGLGQISLWLANAPAEHRLTLCDLSKNMLNRTQQTFEETLQVPRDIQFIHGAAQEVAPNLEPMDLVLFHAVLEWLAQPKETLKTVADKVKPGGHLSLLFYNRNALVYTNVLKGEWRWKHLLDESYIGKGKKLTPPNPQYPEVVIKWLEEWGFTIEAHTGIRVFYDYLTQEVLEKSNLDELLELEYRHCRQPTYRNMGRYIHLVARKS